MKSVALFACFAFLARVLLADMTIVQSLQSDMMPGQAQKESTMTMIIKGQKARVDLPGSQMSSIIDLKAGKMYTLAHKQKQIMAISVEDLKKVSESATRTPAGQAKPSVAKTGKTEVIQGHKCAQYEIKSSAANSSIIYCWITAEIDGAEMEPFQSLGGSLGGFVGLAGAEKPKGMVMRSESNMSVMGRNISSKSEVKSIKRDPVADSIFVLPSDYTVMEMPKLGQPPPAAGQ